MALRFYFLLFVACTFAACTEKSTQPLHGYYLLRFYTDNGTIPVRLDITEQGKWNIINAEEIIQLDSIVFSGDSFFIKLPLFDSSMRGYWRGDSLFGEWTDHSRKDYTVTFTGGTEVARDCDSQLEEFNYNVEFSPGDTSEATKGVAVLQKHGNVVTGTIMTETGDYRYLQGEWKQDTIWLSAFDGTHLFYLRGEVKGDSIINGLFLSGKHWKESWVAIKTPTNTLRNPYSIATIQVNENPTFTVLNSNESPVVFDSSTWKNHASIIQIMGSWCPNCTDESRFLKELYSEYGNRGLQIFPVAFERGDDVSLACKRLTSQFKQLQLPYPFYYGGKANKEEAQKTLHFLTSVHSFPTTVFIDKKGIIRRVYTGYYGPSTRGEYTKHSSEIRSLVNDLLSE